MRLSRSMELVTVGVVTLLAFLLRLSGLWESTGGDELFTLAIAQRSGLGDALDAVHDTAITPPLHYVLVWAAAQVGDPKVWIKVPSLILGTATVPVVYLLGRRTIGASGALVGALVLALSPFAIFYSEEGRAYATLMFLIALSTLLLLEALERRTWGWWSGFAVCSCLVLYAHYSGVFALAAQAAWALWAHREQLRALLLAHAGIVAGFLPWVPAYLDQHDNPGVDYLSTLAPVSAGDYGRVLLAVFPGMPGESARELPGIAPAVLIALVLVAATVGLVVRGVRSQAIRITPASPVLLLTIIALATPVAVLLYSLAGDSILLPRNLSASLPAAVLVIGYLVASFRGVGQLAAAAVLVVALAVGTAQTFGASTRRADTRALAKAIDAQAEPRDAVILPRTFLGPGAAESPLDRGVQIYFERPHPVYYSGAPESRAWTRAGPGGHVFLVKRELSALFRGAEPFAGPGRRFQLIASKRWAGMPPVALYTYRRLSESAFRGATLRKRGDRLEIASFLGHDLQVAPDGVKGFVESITPANGELAIKGWAGDVARHRIVDWVLAFVDGHLVAADRPTASRADILKLDPALLLSGYSLTVSARRPERVLRGTRLRLFAVSGDRAAELMRIGQAKPNSPTG